MHVGTARTGHPEVAEIVPSAHCVKRFRERMPVRAPGVDEVAAALLGALEDADVSGWPPGWAVSDRPGGGAGGRSRTGRRRSGRSRASSRSRSCRPTFPAAGWRSPACAAATARARGPEAQEQDLRGREEPDGPAAGADAAGDDEVAAVLDDVAGGV